MAITEMSRMTRNERDREERVSMFRDDEGRQGMKATESTEQT